MNGESDLPKMMSLADTGAFLKERGFKFNERQVRRMFDDNTIGNTLFRGRRYTTEEALRQLVAALVRQINVSTPKQGEEAA